MVKSFTKTAWSCLLCTALVLSPLSMGGSGVGGVGFHKAQAQQYIPGIGMVIADPPGYEHNHWANACLYRRTPQKESAKDKHEEMLEQCKKGKKKGKGKFKLLNTASWAKHLDCKKPCDTDRPAESEEASGTVSDSVEGADNPDQECQTAGQIIDDLFHPLAAELLSRVKGRGGVDAGGQSPWPPEDFLAPDGSNIKELAQVEVCSGVAADNSWGAALEPIGEGAEGASLEGNPLIGVIGKLYADNSSTGSAPFDLGTICSPTYFKHDVCEDPSADQMKQCKKVFEKWHDDKDSFNFNKQFSSDGECVSDEGAQSGGGGAQKKQAEKAQERGLCVAEEVPSANKESCEKLEEQFEKLCKLSKKAKREKRKNKKSKTEAAYNICPDGNCSPKIRWHDRLFGALPGILGAGLMAWSGREAVRTNARLGWPTDPSAAFSMGFPYLMSGIYGAAYGSRGSLCGPNGINPGMFSGMGPFGGNFNFGMNPFGGFNGGMGPIGMNPFGSHLMNPFGGGFNPGGMNPLYASMFPGMMGGLGNPFGGLGGGLMGGLGPFGGNIGGMWPGMGGLGGFGGLGGLQGQLQLQMQQMQMQAAMQQQALMSRYMQEQQRKGMIVGNLYQQIQRLQMQIQGVLNSGVGGQFGFGGGLGGLGGGGFLGNPTAILPGPGSAGAGAGGTGSYPLMNNILGQ